MTDETGPNFVDLATELTIAWLGNPNTRVTSDDVPAFLRSMHAAVRDLSLAAELPNETSSDGTDLAYAPAVTVRRSLASKDHIISLIDGKPYKTLRRHLGTHGLTPEQYRTRFKLKPDYPMVAENYSEARRAMAKKIGLGNKRRSAGTEAPVTVKPARKTRVKTEATAVVKPARKARVKKAPA